jgi:dTDP-glucose 4,6-dehydratase
MNPPLKREKPQARRTRPRLRCLDDAGSLYGEPVRLLVTGGAGFIGSHFVKRMLAAGEHVVVLDKFTYAGNEANLPEGVDCRRGDIAVREDVDQIGAVDAIVNFAAETHVDRSILGPEEFVRTDVLGTLVLLQAAEELSARLVHVSTDEVYGDVEPGWSSREDDPLRPSSPYSASKAGGDLQVLAAVRTFGVNASVTRGSNTYGPNQYPEKLLPLFVTNGLDGAPLPLYGDGRQVRDWLHVDDHCAAIELVLRQGEAGEVYNVGAGEEHENGELTRLVVEHLGVDPSLVRNVQDRAGHDRRYSLDTTKISELGWAPRHEWDEGVRATIDWYRDNRDWWEPIKRSGGFREYYDKQYAARLG